MQTYTDILNILIKNVQAKFNIYIVGSSTLKYIKNPNDIDVRIVLEEDSKILKRQFFKILKELNYRNFKLCVKVLTKDDFIKNNLISSDNVKYIIPYYKTIDIHIQWGIKDILDNLSEYKKQAIHTLTVEYIYPKVKWWYHVYTVKSIVENMSYVLTEEQIKNINILHDINENDSEARERLIDECANWLGFSKENIIGNI